MKSVIYTAIAVAISALSVLAQTSSINSPHNYKRPVSQKAPQSPNAIVVTSNERSAPLKLENNVTSVHNYKRQGSANFEQEAVLVMNVPTIGITPQNPLMLPNHYKSHFKPIQVEERVARKSEKPTIKEDTLTK